MDWRLGEVYRKILSRSSEFVSLMMTNEAGFYASDELYLIRAEH